MNIKIRLTIAYDGTAYAGWQLQKSGVSAQEKVEEAFGKIFGQPFRVHSSSRTDSGVHAMGMVAHVEIPDAAFRMTPDKLVLALNAFLPPDIRIMDAARVRSDFHARFDARGKEYRYLIWNFRAHHPLWKHMSWHVPRPLNLAEMRRAARHFVGKHDFKSFAGTRSYEMESTVRTVTECALKRSGGMITLVIRGDGFLYKMCRGIAGTLVQVGLGKFSGDEIPLMLKRKDRRVAGMTAPAAGLVLWKVFYGGRK